MRKYTTIVMILAVAALAITAGVEGAVINQRTGASYATLYNAIVNAGTINGDTLYVENGTYNETSYLNIQKSITIEGQSRDGVVIKPAGGTNGVYISYGYTVNIKNLTVWVAVSSVGYGIFYDCSGGLIENVTVNMQGAFANRDGIGGQLLMNNFTLRNVKVQNVSGSNGSAIYLTIAQNNTVKLEGTIEIANCSLPNGWLMRLDSHSSTYTASLDLSSATFKFTSSTAYYGIRFYNIIGTYDMVNKFAGSTGVAVNYALHFSGSNGVYNNLDIASIMNGGIYAENFAGTLSDVKVNMTGKTNIAGINTVLAYTGFRLINAKVQNVTGTNGSAFSLTIAQNNTAKLEGTIEMASCSLPSGYIMHIGAHAGTYRGYMDISAATIKVTGCTAAYGIRLYCITGTCNFSGKFSGWASNSLGYALYIVGGNLTANKIAITSNMSGGLYLESYSGIVSGANVDLGNISNNYDKYGIRGVQLYTGFKLLNDADGNTIVSGVKVNNLGAGAGGVVLQMYSGNTGEVSGVTVTNSTVGFGNSPYVYGSAYCFHSTNGTGNWSVSNLTISNCGGGANSKGITFYYTKFNSFDYNANVTMTNNTLAGYAIYISYVNNSTPTISNITIVSPNNNTTGAMYIGYSSVIISGANLDIGNLADRTGITGSALQTGFKLCSSPTINTVVKRIRAVNLGTATDGINLSMASGQTGTISNVTVDDCVSGCTNGAANWGRGAFFITSADGTGIWDIGGLTVSNCSGTSTSGGIVFYYMKFLGNSFDWSTKVTMTNNTYDGYMLNIKSVVSPAIISNITSVSPTNNKTGNIKVESSSVTIDGANLDIGNTADKTAIAGSALNTGFALKNATVRRIRAVNLGTATDGINLSMASGQTGTISNVTVDDCIPGCTNPSANWGRGCFFITSADGTGIWDIRNIAVTNSPSSGVGYATSKAVQFHYMKFLGNSFDYDANVTLTNNKLPGGALHVRSLYFGSQEIKNVTIKGTNNIGHGLWAEYTNNKFSNIHIDLQSNSNYHGFYGDYLNYTYTGFDLKNILVTGVKQTSGSIYGIFCRFNNASNPATISNATVADCTNLTAGLYVGTYSGTNTWTVKDSIIANNTGVGVLKGTCNLTFINNNVWGNGNPPTPSTNISGVTPNPIDPCINGNITLDPKFTTGTYGNYYLSPCATNPCIDGGSQTAEAAGLGQTANFTTRTDGVYDRGTVDMGKHYPATSGLDWNWKIVFTTAEQTEVPVDEASSVITVQLQDSDGTVITPACDVTINLSTTSTSESHVFAISPGGPWNVTQVTIPAGSPTSEKDFYYKDSAAGTYELEASDAGGQYATATQDITVKSSVASFDIIESEDTDNIKIAGTPFNIDIKAMDDQGELAESYAGPADLTHAGVAPYTGSGTFTPASTGVFGVVDPGWVKDLPTTYSNAGVVRITVTDPDTGANGTEDFTFVPKSFTVVPASYEQVVGKPFNLNITALNAAGAVCTEYRGNATLSIPATAPTGAVVTPTALTGDYWIGKNGVAEVETAYNRWGETTFICKDDTLTTQTGISKTVTFHPNNFLITISAPPASRDFYYINEEFNVLITAMDGSEPSARISNYGGTVTFTSPSLTKPVNYTYTAADAGTHTFTFKGSTAVTDTTFTVADTAYAASLTTSSKVTVKKGTISPPSSMYAFMGTANAILFTIKDSSGNVITNDSSTTFKVDMDEASNDESCKISANYNGPYTDSGVATFTVTDGEALLYILNSKPEIVTVTPITTDPTINTASGMVHFGSQTSGGLALDKWRDKGDTVRGKVAR